ncbi:MAG TPA: ABC transporter permease [Candidatus Acidoferrales bacterium]|nr:ABC transporter permease [Candidatus Acidoferrales bacterium]
MSTLMQDLRYAVRMMTKAPGFTAIAILTLALGIGANTALFSVVNGVLLSPLPYANPNQLVAVGENLPGFSDTSIAYANFLDWQKDNHTFAALAIYRPDNFNLTGTGEAERVKAMRISASFFPVLGVQPVAGRNFTQDEDRRGAAPTVMLSEGFWKSKFGGSREILGKTLTLDGTGATVIGIVPEKFNFADAYFLPGNVYVAIGAWANPGIYDRSNNQLLMYGIGRLKTGVTLGQARADMDGIARNLAKAFPDADKNVGVALTPLKQHIVYGVQPFLLVLLAAVGFVLLIACLNVANLLLARSASRSREFAIRAALGASQGRVIRQLLTESLLLAVAGGGLGLLVASWGTQAALKVLPGALPRAGDVRLDPGVLLFTLAVSALAGVIFGLVPAVKASHPDLHETLKEGGRGGSGIRYRTQRIFVVAEMALAVVLLIGAGLAIRSLMQLWNVDPGFNTRNVLTFEMSMPASTSHETPDQVRANLRQMTDTIAAVPGVKAVSLAAGGEPLAGDDEIPFWVDGRTKPSTTSEMPQTLWYMVDADYLKVMQTPLIRGRFLTAEDNAHSRAAGVIDENFARKYFPNEDPIGKRLNFYFLKPIEIVGVVRHVKQWGLDNDASGPVQVELYTSMMQLPDRWMPEWTRVGLMVRTQAPNYASAASIQKALQKMNSEQVAYGFESMEGIVADSLASRRFSMILLGVFAAIALLLASIGIYGVISYVAGQRTHEIGIRLALGAQRSDVLKLVLGQGVKMALIGVAIGMVAAAGLTRLMKAILFGVSATDPITFAGVAIVLTIVALAACYIPARRAMRVDPMVALRYE